MKLFAKNLHFLGETQEEQVQDLCVHGTPTLVIDGFTFTDGTDWCVSASAFRFLQTLSGNHFRGAAEQMFPCCGHFMIPSEDLQTVTIGGCSNGIDFNVIHEDGMVLLLIGGSIHTVPYEKYREAVLAYTRQIEDFFHANPPREFDSEFEKKGFTAFCNQWYAMKEKPLNVFFSLEDESVCSHEEFQSCGYGGVSLYSRFINFEECAYHFRRENDGDGKCVGERDDDTQEITFYTAPHPVTISFAQDRPVKRRLFRKEISKITYRELLDSISSYGYTTVPTP